MIVFVETLLYTLDCVRLSLAEDIDTTLTTFDEELLDYGASDRAS